MSKFYISKEDLDNIVENDNKISKDIRVCVMGKEPLYLGINWSALGTVDEEDGHKFAKELNIVLSAINYFNRQKYYLK